MFNLQPIVYVYFGFLFLLGWLLYFSQGLIAVFAKRGWPYFVTAHLCLGMALAGFLLRGGAEASHFPYWQFVLVLFNGLSVAFFCAAFIGLFSRYCKGFNPWVRYFSDSAYWVFILHQTVLVALALLIYDWTIVAELKFLLVSGGTLAICLISYHYGVRTTWLGALLNGRRYARALPVAEQAADGSHKLSRCLTSDA